MADKGLQGQYAGFVSRAVALLGDLLLIIAITILLAAMIRLPMQLLFGIDIVQCEASSLPGLLGQVVLQTCLVTRRFQLILPLLVPPLYFSLFWSLGGQTPVQYAMGIRVVRLDGKRMDFGRALLRYFSLYASLLPLGLGYLWVLWDNRRQGFHDKLAGTVVVYAWPARQNEFLLDRMRQRLRRRALSESLRKAMQEAPSDAKANIPLELVLAIFPSYNDLGRAIERLQSSVNRGQLRLVNTIALVKDETGAIGTLGASDLAPGDETVETLMLMARDPRVRKLEPERLLVNAPAGSFALAIVAEDPYLAPLLKALSTANGTVQVFDLDTPAHAPMAAAQASSLLPPPSEEAPEGQVPSAVA
ncbi:MAG: RDD family protein [Caldilineales bacterium]|nr:RDD family protein [Caldilineales bacterium]MDW8317428.1 RDD family protein [Anaerolineae bacterium]